MFRDLVLARLIEVTSKLDSLRVLAEVGIEPVSYAKHDLRGPLEQHDMEGACGCQFPASWYLSTTLLGMRPRGETGMPLEAAQARTADVSADALVWRICLPEVVVLRPADTHGSRIERSFWAALASKSISYRMPSRAKRTVSPAPSRSCLPVKSSIRTVMVF